MALFSYFPNTMHINQFRIFSKCKHLIQLFIVTFLMASRMKQSKLSSISTAGNRKNLDKSLEEQVYEMEIHNIQAQRLRKTFMRMCGAPVMSDADKYKNDQEQNLSRNPPKKKFDKKDIIRILTELNFPYSKPEVDQWIWEVDEDLDGCINQYEFTLMYKRCIFDKTGLEPRNLFNLVQFLMYDIQGRGKITVEDTLQLIYVRQPEQLQARIFDIFGDKQKTQDGQQRQILFEEYLKQMRKCDLQRRKRLEEERKTVTKVNLKKEQD